MPESDGAVVVAVDQGTSSTKALALDSAGEVVGWGVVPVASSHPRPGWVEQDPDEIADSVLAAIRQAVRDVGDRVVAVGISSQRESAVAWDRATGAPIGPMLGWQDRRTAGRAAELAHDGIAQLVREVTGLPLDPMFSALKFGWILDSVDPDRRRAAAGELALGTVDSWLVQRLTGEHRIEAGNASRTQLLDLRTLDWSDELLELFDVPRATLPVVAASDVPTAPIAGVRELPPTVRVHAVLGDSHAALFGHGVRSPGAVKVTLGTGSSVMGLLDAGADAGAALATTVAWSAPDARYAFEGNVLAAGATLVWLAGVLGTDPEGVVDLARSDDGGSAVDLVPAFAGLGAPWWDPNAQALISGFDLGTSRAALALAAVESIPLQIGDVLDAAERATDRRIDTVLIDGGPATNDWLAQRLADLTQRTVARPDLPGASAVGAAHLAGIGAGVWSDDDVLAFDRRSVRFEPRLSADLAGRRRTRWRRAVDRARGTTTIPFVLEEETP